MNDVNVWYNHGRWITQCPVCRSKTQIKPVGKSGKQRVKWYCGNCYPGKLKRKLKVNPKGEIAYAYSRKDQLKAAGDAYNTDGIHTAVFPEDWIEAERLLRLRHRNDQHYRPHEIYKNTGRNETAADLDVENKTLMMLTYTQVEKKVSAVSINELVAELIERKELPPELYKELQ